MILARQMDCGGQFVILAVSIRGSRKVSRAVMLRSVEMSGKSSVWNRAGVKYVWRGDDTTMDAR